MALTAEQIRAMAIKDVEIIGFDEEPIIVKLKTLSLLGLAGSGKIPNSLLGTAMIMFEGKSSNKKSEDDKDNMSDMSKLIDVICMNALVEPSYEEIGDILTDDQKMEIFYYTQGGLKSLESFRKKQTVNVIVNDSPTV